MNEFNNKDIVKFKKLLNEWLPAEEAKSIILKDKQKPKQYNATDYLFWTTVEPQQVQQEKKVEPMSLKGFYEYGIKPSAKQLVKQPKEIVEKTYDIAKWWLWRIKEAWEWLVIPREDIWRTYTFPEAATRWAWWALQTVGSPFFGTFFQWAQNIWWVVEPLAKDIYETTWEVIPDVVKDIIENKIVDPSIEWVKNWWDKQTPEQKQQLKNVWVWLEVLSYYAWFWLYKALKGKAPISPKVPTTKPTVPPKTTYPLDIPKVQRPLKPVWKTLEAWLKEVPTMKAPFSISQSLRNIQRWPKEFKWVVWETPKITQVKPDKIIKEWINLTKSDDLIQRWLRPTIKGKDTWDKMDIYKTKIREWVESTTKRKWIPDDWIDALNKVWESKKDVWKQIENNQSYVNKVTREWDIADDIYKFLDNEENYATLKAYPWLEKKLTKYIENFTTNKKLTQQQLLDLKTKQAGKIPSDKWAELLTTDKEQLLADSIVSRIIWRRFDDAIEEVLWVVNKNLMREYWALRTLEKDLARRMWVFTRNTKWWLTWLTDIFTLPDIIVGWLTWDLKQLWKWALWKIASYTIKRWENPNVIIKELFKIHSPKKPWFIEKAIWTQEFKWVPKKGIIWPKNITKETKSIKSTSNIAKTGKNSISEASKTSSNKNISKTKKNVSKSVKKPTKVSKADERVRNAIESHKQRQKNDWFELLDRLKERSVQLTNKLKDDALKWLREEYRITNKNISKYKDIFWNKKPTDTITVYRWAKNNINIWDQVTIDKLNAQKYIWLREWAQLQEMKVKVWDLIRNEWLRTEFIYVPKKSIKKPLINKWGYINPTEIKNSLKILNTKNITTTAWKIAKQLWIEVWKVKELLKWYVQKYWTKLKDKIWEIFDDLADKLWVRSKLLAWEKAQFAPLWMKKKAIDLTKAWKKPNEVWKKTWWEKWKDGKWRFEIDDTKAKVKSYMQIEWWEGTKLTNILKHDDLYKQYPKLKDTKVIFDDLWDTTAKFIPESNKIIFNVNKLKTKWTLWKDRVLDRAYSQRMSAPKAPKRLQWLYKKWDEKSYQVFELTAKDKSNLLHEIQHNIQKVEWFTKWTSSKTAWSYSKYRRTAWEVEARNVEKRALLSKPKKIWRRPSLTEDIPRSKQIVTKGSQMSAKQIDDLFDFFPKKTPKEKLLQFKREIKAWMHNDLINKILEKPREAFSKRYIIKYMNENTWIKKPNKITK